MTHDAGMINSVQCAEQEGPKMIVEQDEATEIDTKIGTENCKPTHVEHETCTIHAPTALHLTGLTALTTATPPL